ncbi:DUF998 domain-containing protein [Massilia sp. BJB1822]|uniref:DUF998 domain-containing protein n=1 Tax=Massilia sp. BJB1822 TaxID=2744470 RepID=UPI00159449E4|nr:DUF998 domain-containing protein [Massilia sp. BJB1822]NVE01215.1 DUF998 domain-containing protein [Massilia sp. BJB1822]
MAPAPASGGAAWLAGLLAGVLFFASLISFAAWRGDGYAHGRKAVSELGALGAPAAPAFNLLGFIVPGLLLAWFAYALLRVADRRTGPALLMGSGLMLAAAGIFPLDPDDYGSVLTIAHAIGAMGSGLLWAMALCWLGPLFARQLGWKVWGRLTPCFMGFVLLNIGWQAAFRAGADVLPGWGQRIGFLGYFLWFAVTAILLWKRRALIALGARTMPGQAPG